MEAIIDPMEDCFAFQYQDDAGPQAPERKRQRLTKTTCTRTTSATTSTSTEESTSLPNNGSAEPSFLHTALGASPCSIQLFHHPTASRHQIQEKQQHARVCFQRLEEYLQHSLSHLDGAQWRQVLGFLLLHVNSLFVTMPTHDEEKTEMVTLLCRCIRMVLEQTTHKAKDKDKDKDKDIHIHRTDSLQAALDLVVDYAIPMTRTALKTTTPAGTQLLQVVLALVLLFLGIAKNHHTFQRTPALHEFLLHVLATHKSLVDAQSFQTCQLLVQHITNKDTAKDHQLSVLPAMYNHNHNHTNKNKNKNKNKEPTKMIAFLPSSPHQSIQNCRFLAQSKKGATALSQDMDVLDQLVHVAISTKPNGNDELAYRAADCLSRIAVQRQHDIINNNSNSNNIDHIDWTMDALLRVLTGTSDRHIQSATLEGLLSCQPGKIPWQNHTFLGQVLSSLFGIVKTPLHNYNNNNNSNHATSRHCKQDAATILLDILETNQNTKTPQSSSSGNNIVVLPYTQAMSYVGELLLMYDEPSLQQMAVQFVARQEEVTTTHHDHQRLLVLPSILNDLGALACDALSCPRMIHSIMAIWEKLSRKDTKALSILARQVKVLDALVVVATGRHRTSHHLYGMAVPEPETQQQQHHHHHHHHHQQQQQQQQQQETQELALVVLVRLSQDVCNRRIVATHTGVLSCLIRFARAQAARQIQQPARNDDDIPPGLTLDHLKQKIMELTVAI
jgi:hypothetical protein